MQITEKSGEGLSRVYGVTVPADMLAERLTAKIEEMRPRMNIKGFRPGKVPAAHVRRLYGKGLMGEVVQQAIDESAKQALGEIPAGGRARTSSCSRTWTRWSRARRTWRSTSRWT
jgi:trigger factor